MKKSVIITIVTVIVLIIAVLSLISVPNFNFLKNNENQGNTENNNSNATNTMLIFLDDSFENSSFEKSSALNYETEHYKKTCKEIIDDIFNKSAPTFVQKLNDKMDECTEPKINTYTYKTLNDGKQKNLSFAVCDFSGTSIVYEETQRILVGIYTFDIRYVFTGSTAVGDCIDKYYSALGIEKERYSYYSKALNNEYYNSFVFQTKLNVPKAAQDVFYTDWNDYIS